MLANDNNYLALSLFIIIHEQSNVAVGQIKQFLLSAVACRVGQLKPPFDFIIQAHAPLVNIKEDVPPVAGCFTALIKSDDCSE